MPVAADTFAAQNQNYQHMKKCLFSFLMICGFAIVANAQNFKTVRIGNQIWMAENLNITVPDSWCYNDNPGMGPKYGRLYTWEAAKKACPAGWRLPTENDWAQLIDFLGGEDKAGKQLRMGGSCGFNASLGGLTDVGNYRLLDMYGTFWTSSSYDSDHAWYIYITSTSSNVTKTYFSKKYGFSVRYIKAN